MNTKYPMSQLAKKPHHIERIEVQSFEMNVYLVKVTIAGQTGFVLTKKAVRCAFTTRKWFRDLFEHCTVDSAVMTHDSPYDEMIGNPMKASDVTEMPFSMDQPY